MMPNDPMFHNVIPIEDPWFQMQALRTFIIVALAAIIVGVLPHKHRDKLADCVDKHGEKMFYIGSLMIIIYGFWRIIFG